MTSSLQVKTDIKPNNTWLIYKILE